MSEPNPDPSALAIDAPLEQLLSVSSNPLLTTLSADELLAFAQQLRQLSTSSAEIAKKARATTAPTSRASVSKRKAVLDSI